MRETRHRIVLVTGGCGFIGSSFVRHILLANPGWTVLNLDKLTYAGNAENLADVESSYGSSLNDRLAEEECRFPRYVFVRGDICDRSLIHSLLSGEWLRQRFEMPSHTHVAVDAVVNFAAETHVDKSINSAEEFVETNVKGTQVLLDAARRVKLKAFIQVSTDEVYGTLDDSGYFTEESALEPNNPYAASKAAADLLCRAYHRTHDIPVIITRSSNNYGPRQFPEKLIPLMIHNAVHGMSLPLYGKGLQIRDWLFVEDNCRAIHAALQHGRAGEVYNIGAGCERRNIDVVTQICDELVLKERSIRESLVPFDPHGLISYVDDPRGNSHDFRYGLDCSKIQRELHWKPKVLFENGIALTIDWYLGRLIR